MVKQLLKSVREFKKDALLTPFFVVLEVVMEVHHSVCHGGAHRQGHRRTEHEPPSGNTALSSWRVRHARARIRRGGRHLCCARFDRLCAQSADTICTMRCRTFSFSNIDKFSTGSIVTRLTTDVTNVQNAFQMCTRIAVRCPVMLIFAFVHGRRRSTETWRSSSLPCCRFSRSVMGILMKMVGPVFERVFKIYDRLNTVVQENVHGIRVVKAYVREDHEAEKFENVSDTAVPHVLQGAEDPGVQYAADAVLHVRVHAAHLVVRRASDRRAVR